MTYSPDDAASMAEYLIESGLGPTARDEAMVQAAAAKAERILARLGYGVDKERRPAPQATYRADDDGEEAQAKAAADQLGAVLVRRMEKGDRGREYRHPGYGNEFQ